MLRWIAFGLLCATCSALHADEPPAAPPAAAAPQPVAPQPIAPPAAAQQPAAAAGPTVQTGLGGGGLPEPKSARDLIGMYGVDGSRLGFFNDGQSIQPAENESLLRVLIAVRRFSYGELLRWQLKEIPWGRWTEDAYQERGEVIALKLKVNRATRIALAPDLAERFDLQHYYQCEVTVDENQPATVYALTIPRQWKLDEPLDERSAAAGFFLKLADAAPRPLHPIFVAQRLACFPDTELGQLGMDVGLFEGLKNMTPFQAKDGPCFYELLAAVGRASNGELLRLTHDDDPLHPRYPVVPLFLEPDKQFGKLVALSGTCRRCVKLTVDNPDVVKVLGYDHYFQLEMFTIDSNKNPVTWCVRELPDGMPQGERLDVDIRVAGFFFKTWLFPVQIPGQKEDRQFAPALVGRAPVLLQPPKFSNSFGHAVTVVVVIVLAVTVFSLWLMNRGDRQARKRLARPAAAPVQLDDLPDIKT